MNLTLNGTRITTAAASLQALLDEHGFGEKVATARNGAFVPKNGRDIALEPGDVIEVLAPMQGG